MSHYTEMITKIADATPFSPRMIEAICVVESAMNPWATRFEPRWRWFVSPKAWSKRVGITERTEHVHQQTSWGLLQPLGAVCRELGYKGPLPALCDPCTGLTWGVTKLLDIKQRHPLYTIDQILQSYNAGHPGTAAGKRYSRKVMEVWGTI